MLVVLFFIVTLLTWPIAPLLSFISFLLMLYSMQPKES